MSDQFVYRHLQNEYTRKPFSVRHRVTKKTATHLHVDRGVYEVTVGDMDKKLKTFTLDRVAFERDGYALGQRLRGLLQMFYNTPEGSVIV